MENPEFGERVKRIRLHRKLSQEALAKAVGVSQPAIRKIEAGGRTRVGREIADALGVSLKWLETGIEEGDHSLGSFDVNVVPAAVGDRRIPLINYVQAGQLTEIGANFSGGPIEYLLTDLPLSQHAFALEIQGLSMLSEFHPGDRIIVDQEVAPIAGDYVVAKNGEQEATFKKYRPRGINERGQEVFELVPLNQDFASLYSDRQPLQIIATMMEHRKYRRR